MISFFLSNIKSFLKTDDIELRKINIFVGKNSSGKSSLLRFPVLLSQTFQEEVYTPILFSGQQIDYGNYDDVKYKKSEDLIKFGLNFNPRIIRDAFNNGFYNNSILSRDLMSEVSKSIGKMGIEVKINKHNKKIIVEEIKLLMSGRLVATVKRDEKSTYKLEVFELFQEKSFVKLNEKLTLTPEITFTRFIPHLNFYGEKSIISIFKQINRAVSLVEDEYIEDLVGNVSFRDVFNTSSLNIGVLTENQEKFVSLARKIFVSIALYDSAFLSMRRELTRLSNEITYIGPFRKDPERIYRDSESNFIDVGKNGENASMILRQAQQSKPEILAKVSNWFEKSMGYSIKIEEIDNSNLFKLMVHSDSSNISSNIIDVGYGIAQVLPIVTQIFLEKLLDDEVRRSYIKSSPIKTFVFEQPELHLHPAAQANLADLFVEKVTLHSASRFLVETHSEHFIRRLQVLIADPDCELKHSDVAIYYVDKTLDGYSEVSKMHINQEGQFLEKWPSGFFDKSYELSKELLYAARKRESK